MSYDRAQAVETCRSKRWYQTREDAIKAAADFGSMGLEGKYPYQCVICGLYHLSKREPDPRRSAALEWLEDRYRRESKRR